MGKATYYNNLRSSVERWDSREIADGKKRVEWLIARLSGIMKDYTMELVRENHCYPRSMAEKHAPSVR